MARKGSPTISQEELYPSDEDVRPDLDDARMLDLDAEEESPFLRGQKRVSARRGPLPRKAAHWLKWILAATVLFSVGSIAAGSLYSYSEHSWRFRIQSSDDIEISGNHNVSHAQVMEVLGGDIGRNIFFVPLAQRRTLLEQIPWVESASVMRFIPNRLKVEIHERTPVAFARVGSRISLTDAGGTLMDLPATNKTKYSFPVIVGMNTGEPHSTRAARMHIYNDLVSQLDSGGARYSQDLSEVDLSDPEDVKVVANDPQGAVLVHLGNSSYLDRYKVYVSHIREWRQQFDKLESVDLRYDRQIIVNPDLRNAPKQAPLSASAAHIAAAAGVKPAALISHIAPSTGAKAKPVPSAKTSNPRPAAKTVQPKKSKYAAAPSHKKNAAAKVPAGKAATAKSKDKPKKALVPAVAKQTASNPKIKKPSPAVAKEKEQNKQ